MRRTTRRQFVKTAVSAAGALALRSVPTLGSSPAARVSRQLSVFPYANIQLLDGPFRKQFEQNHNVFLNLDEDGLLKPFRKRQGMPAPGPNLGGWYDDADRKST